MSEAATLAAAAKAWPFEQARLVVERLKKSPKDGPVVFETGYGPSGLPHIGTFQEVARTTMVRHAFRVLTDDKIPTRLIAFSDDMDGLRKVPDNIPNKEVLAANLHKPLTQIPDPFGCHQSFAHHNNAKLREFLDGFGFEYEFLSSTEQYKSGRFDEALLTMLDRFDAVMAIMLPTLGEDRRATYSPFLPISPKTGKVLQVPTLARNFSKGTIVFEDEDGEKIEVPVTGGNVKIQWKPDWALRWTALGVDYEMSGKDLIDSVQQSSKICRALGGTPPEGFNYELFLDDTGQKISKSKGNGLAVEEWLRYAPPESLSLYMYQKPKTAKRLFFDVIPKVNAEVRTALQARWPGTDVLATPILRPGSWIGGDRDGNPNVTADVVRLATGSAAYTAFDGGSTWPRISITPYLETRNQHIAEPRPASTGMGIREDGLLVRGTILEVDMISMEGATALGKSGTAVPDGVPSPLAGYSPAITCGDWVFLAGEIPVDWQGDYGRSEDMGEKSGVAREARTNPYFW